MIIEFYAPYWGSEHVPFTEFTARAAEAGFDGVERSFPRRDTDERDAHCAAIEKAGLKLIAQHWETENPNPKAHLEEYTDRLRFLTGSRPEFISSQTGRDFFEFEDNLRLLAAAAAASEESGIPIIHETHRSKLTFAAHITRKFLEKLPGMRLTLDVSHWFCVHERYLEYQPDAVGLALERTDHIHARIGHTQGSQVADFRRPEYRDALDAHLAIWDIVAGQARSEGRKRLTVTPEFGPPPYMTELPESTGAADRQWELNIAMMNLLRERWSD